MQTFLRLFVPCKFTGRNARSAVLCCLRALPSVCRLTQSLRTSCILLENADLVSTFLPKSPDSFLRSIQPRSSAFPLDRYSASSSSIPIVVLKFDERKAERTDDGDDDATPMMLMMQPWGDFPRSHSPNASRCTQRSLGKSKLL